MSKASIVSICKRDILDIFNFAVDAVKPESIVKNIVSIKDNVLAVRSFAGHENETSINLDKSNIHVIGGGKSVLGLARGLAELAKKENVTHLFSHGAISVPVGLRSTLHDQATEDLLKFIGVKCSFGSNNNLPDEASIKASQAILDNVVRACRKDQLEGRQPIFIVLLSGGGSACLTKPKHIDLDKKLKISKFLVQKGVDITTLNKVRRYFSHIKGGQLANHILRCHPQSKILTLILSDVIGDNIEFIASGPTFISEENSIQECKKSMLEVLKKYQYPDIERLSNFETQDSGLVDIKHRLVINRVIGSNSLALDAAKHKANLLGYNVKCLGNDLQGFSDQVVKKIYDSSREGEKTSNKFLVLAGGEATINKLDGETWGKGGRAQEMALDYIIMRLNEKQERQSDNVDVFLAGGTDGQDGPTDVAGCLSSLAEYKLAPSYSIKEAYQAKLAHDSYNFWSNHKPDWLIRTGLTGTNVMDLYMLLLF